MEAKGSSSSTTTASFRWTPTREQVAILEGVYREGIRTPSTEQIQELTRRLREFGEIEGKNVFYWFQNHKARQRQKIKQEQRASILSRLYRYRPPPPPPPPPLSTPPHYPHYRPDVVYAPYCVAIPQGGASCGYYHQMAGRIKTVPKQVHSSQEGYFSGKFVANEAASTHQETLLLFPLQPSGIVLEERSGGSVTSSLVEEGEDEDEDEGRSENMPFFNFLGPSQGNI